LDEIFAKTRLFYALLSKKIQFPDIFYTISPCPNVRVARPLFHETKTTRRVEPFGRPVFSKKTKGAFT
jgi:hypothetical protein